MLANIHPPDFNFSWGTATDQVSCRCHGRGQKQRGFQTRSVFAHNGLLHDSKMASASKEGVSGRFRVEDCGKLCYIVTVRTFNLLNSGTRTSVVGGCHRSSGDNPQPPAWTNRTKYESRARSERVATCCGDPFHSSPRFQRCSFTVERNAIRPCHPRFSFVPLGSVSKRACGSLRPATCQAGSNKSD